jgi:transposase
LGVEVAKSEQWQCIPTRLSIEQFQQFVLPHLSIGSRGPAPKLTLHAVFNYILQSLYLGCQWKELPIEKDQEGRPEIHYTRIYGAFRRWQADGCFEAVFAGSVLKLHQANLLDTRHPRRRYDDRGEERRRQHRFQRTQEGERRQDCRFL